MQGEQKFQLLQIGLHGRLHVGILQLAGQRLAVLRRRLVDLAQGRGCGRIEIEGAETLTPFGSEFGLHAPFHERCAHGRRFALQLLQLGCIFRRHQIRNGGEQLRHLHDRTFQATQRLRQRGRIRCVLSVPIEKPRAGHPRRHAAHIGADPGIARRTRGKSVRFAIGSGHPRRPYETCSIDSSSMISPSIIDRPICQNFGSRASSPKGASSSE